MSEYPPGHYKGWDDIPDVEEPEPPCSECGGEGTVWTQRPDPQDDVELPCRACRPDAFMCWRCHDTGYVRNFWTRRREPCPECWSGPDD